MTMVVCAENGVLQDREPPRRAFEIGYDDRNSREDGRRIFARFVWAETILYGWMNIEEARANADGLLRCIREIEADEQLRY